MSSKNDYEEFFGIDFSLSNDSMSERSQTSPATTTGYTSNMNHNRKSVRQLEDDAQRKEKSKASQLNAQSGIPSGNQPLAKIRPTDSREMKEPESFAVKARERARRLLAASESTNPINGDILGAAKCKRDLCTCSSQKGSALTSLSRLDSRITTKVAEMHKNLTADTFTFPIAAKNRLVDEEIATNSDTLLKNEVSVYRNHNSDTYCKASHSVLKSHDLTNQVIVDGCNEGISSSDKMTTTMSDRSLEDTEFTSSHFREIFIEESTAGKPINPNTIDTIVGLGNNTTATKTLKGLAVAFAVDEVKDDQYIAAAVEYDPDDKPTLYENRHFRLYWLIACLVASIGFVVILFSIGIGQERNRTNDSIMQPQLPYRETLGIRGKIARIVGTDRLDNATDPFNRALQWITHDDPLQLMPTEATFVQRYLLASMYFSTLKNGSWGYCNPPALGSNETIDCVYEKIVKGSGIEEEVVKTQITWKRWLSNTTECNWTGITCNDDNFVIAIEICKYKGIVSRQF
jgi:hypothetical protein